MSVEQNQTVESRYTNNTPQTPYSLDHLPGDYGLPVVGHTLDFLRDYRGHVLDMYNRHGPIYRTSTFFRKSVTLLGPEANELVLMDRERNFSSRLGWGHLLGQLFTNGLMLRDFDDHRTHRKVMQVAFKKEAMRAYLDDMNPVITETLPHWQAGDGAGGQMAFYPAIKQLTLDIAAKVFAGAPMGSEAGKINQAFIDTVAATIALVRTPIPGLAFHKGLRGRKTLQDYYETLVPKRRGSNQPDMLTQLCNAVGEDGERFSDQEIVDHMIFLMMAAHDTTTSALTTMVYALGKHPHWQEQVRAEIAALGGGPVQFTDLDNLQLTEYVFREALRRYSPVPALPRRALRDFEFMGYEIPADSGVTVSLSFTHMMPEIWPDPEKFDPLRFAPERAEDRKHKFAWVPFGGGAHKCIGLHFAYMQVKAVIGQMLQKYQIELPEHYTIPMKLVPIPKPNDGLPIRLRPL